jgi:hypothetical protein
VKLLLQVDGGPMQLRDRNSPRFWPEAVRLRYQSALHAAAAPGVEEGSLQRLDVQHLCFAPSLLRTTPTPAAQPAGRPRRPITWNAASF